MFFYYKKVQTLNIVGEIDYYPFGLPMRSFDPERYRYGFQGPEHEDDIYYYDNDGDGIKDAEYVGAGINYAFRMHDARIG